MGALAPPTLIPESGLRLSMRLVGTTNTYIVISDFLFESLAMNKLYEFHLAKIRKPPQEFVATGLRGSPPDNSPLVNVLDPIQNSRKGDLMVLN